MSMYATQSLARFESMRSRDAGRDRTMRMIRAVRRGNLRQLFPSELDFDLTFEGVPTANFIDDVAHDLSEGIAPLPSLACVSGRMKTDADQKRAERKNRIGQNYWRHSDLATQAFPGSDRYVTYGFTVGLVEPDTTARLPYIRLEDSRGSHYTRDRWGNIAHFGRCYHKTVDELCDLYPEHAGIINPVDPSTGGRSSGDSEIELVRWVDGTRVSLFLPQRQGLILDSYEHRMTRPPVVVAERPSLDGMPRGQFDDVVWVQVARAIIATLGLEAAYTAVQAPIAIPNDMDELPVGPNSVYQSDDPDKIHRVNLELPNGIFAQEAVMQQEMQTGARYPAARQGNINASVVTGKGVEALLGTFDSQIKSGQVVFKKFLEDATSMCFEMDEKWWPQRQETVSGTLSGSSYEFDYTPSTDIDGRYGCTVTYGFAAGMAPAQSIITMLQLEGAGLIAKGTTQENLPFSIDHIQETKKINVEQSREALKQGVFALVQSSGAIAAQGQDAMPIIQLGVDAIKGLQNGKSVEDAVAAAYQALEERQQQAQAQAQQQAQEQAQQQAGQSPMNSQNLPPGVAAGQAGMPAGGQPTVEDLVAGFRGNGNRPLNSVKIRRQQATGIR